MTRRGLEAPDRQYFWMIQDRRARLHNRTLNVPAETQVQTRFRAALDGES